MCNVHDITPFVLLFVPFLILILRRNWYCSMSKIYILLSSFFSISFGCFCCWSLLCWDLILVVSWIVRHRRLMWGLVLSLLPQTRGNPPSQPQTCSTQGPSLDPRRVPVHRHRDRLTSRRISQMWKVTRICLSSKTSIFVWIQLFLISKNCPPSPKKGWQVGDRL